RKDMALYRSHLPEATAVSVLEDLAEGNGIRQTARLVRVPVIFPAPGPRRRRERPPSPRGTRGYFPSDARDPARREAGLRRQEAE
ncbi:MAG: hypothetical protein WKF75_13560, partial [Singulisphaera sp.]